MTYPDPHDDRITNPDDPYDREWGTGTAVTVIVAILIIAGIVAYEASTATDTRVSSTLSRTTQQDGAIDQNAKESLGWQLQKSCNRFSLVGKTATSI